MQLVTDWDTGLSVLKNEVGVGIKLSYGECRNSTSEWYYLSSIKAFDRWFARRSNENVLNAFDSFLDGLFTQKHHQTILSEAKLLLEKIQEFEGTHVNQRRFVRLKLEHGSSPENVPHVDFTELGLLEWTRGLRVFVGPRCMACDEEHVDRFYAKQYNASQVSARLQEITRAEGDRLAGEAIEKIARPENFLPACSDRILFKGGPNGLVHMAANSWKGPRLTLIVNQETKFIYGDEFD